MKHVAPTPATKANPYTPTHTADGRKLTRAERKAANKAKWAAQQAARMADAPKPKGKGKGKQAPKPAPAPAPAAKQAPMKVADVKAWMDANKRRKQFTPQEIADFTQAQAPAPAEGEGEGEPAPAPKPKGAKAKAVAKAEREAEREALAEERRIERNERKAAWVEAKAQRASIRTQQARRAKEAEGATIVVGADGGEAQPFERRMEVPAPPKQERKPLVLEHEDLSAYDGLTLEEASRLRYQRWAEVTAEDCL